MTLRGKQKSLRLTNRSDVAVFVTDFRIMELVLFHCDDDGGGSVHLCKILFARKHFSFKYLMNRFWLWQNLEEFHQNIIFNSFQCCCCFSFVHFVESFYESLNLCIYVELWWDDEKMAFVCDFDVNFFLFNLFTLFSSV